MPGTKKLQARSRSPSGRRFTYLFVEFLEDRRLLAATPIPSGAIAWWRGEGNANDSIATNHGSPLNGAGFATGLVGQAFSFDGTNDLIDVAGSYFIQGPRTIEAWVFPRPNTSDDGLPIVSAGVPLNGSIFPIDFFGVGAAVGLYEPRIDHWGSNTYSAGVAVINNAWNHVAMTYDGTTIRFYVNGVAGNAVVGSLYDYPIGTLDIGGNRVGGTTTLQSMDGLLDEVTLYSRALAASELQAIYQAGSDGKYMAMHVGTTSPAPGDALAVPATDFTIDFALPYDLASVQANDLAVNGKPADSFVALDADTIRFHYIASPVIAPGLQTMAIVAGAITTIVPGVVVPAVAGWTATFQALLPSMTVKRSMPAVGGTVTTKPTEFLFDFSSPYNLSSVNATDLIVNGKPADSFFVTDANAITFRFNTSPVTAVGMQTMSLAVGAITTGSGAFEVGIPAWAGSFGYILSEPNGPIAWWTGDDSADDSIGANHGAPVGATSYANGLVGPAFNFLGGGDGDGHGGFIQVPDSPLWNFWANDFTVNLWVNFHSLNNSGNNSFNGFLGQTDGNSQWAFWLAGESLEFFMHPAGYSGYGVTIQPTSGYRFSPTPGRWYNIALTKDDTGCKFLVDGVVVGTNGWYPMTDVAGPLTIGAGGAAGSAIDGLIDNVKLYKRALSPSEILTGFQVISQAASAVNDTYATPKENTLQVAAPGLLSNDAGPLAAVLVDAPVHGLLTLSPAGGFTYMPSAGYVGPDSFSYRASESPAAPTATVFIDVTSPIPSPLPVGAIAWWKGDGNAIDSIGNYDGTPKLAAGYSPGKVLQAFELNGGGDGDGHGGYIEVPDSPDWAFGSKDYTFNFWVNFRTLNNSGNNSFNGFMGQDDGSSKWAFWLAGEFLELYVKTPQIPGYGVTAQFGSFKPTIGTWYNISLVKNGGSTTAYVDGLAIGTNSYPIPDVDAPLTIGAGGGGGSALDGSIDELMIFGRGLTTVEVKAIYNAASAGLIVYAEDGAQSIDDFAQTVFIGLPPGGSPDLTFTITNDNTPLFKDQPKIDSTGRLTFTPAPNSQGKAIVTVTLKSQSQTPTIKTYIANGAEGESFDVAEDPTATFEIEVVQRYPWQNDNAWPDTDDDDYIAPNDALLVIDYINGYGSTEDDSSSSGPYYDTSGDGWVSPIDALGVINVINVLGDAMKLPLSELDIPPEGEGRPAGVAFEARARSVDLKSPALSTSAADLLALLAIDQSELSARRRR